MIAGVWAAGSALICAIVLSLADGSPSGRAFAVLGGALVLGELVALGLVAVNASLSRDARRTDAGGAADFLTLAALLISLATVVVGPLVTRPYGAVTFATALVGVVELAILVLVALATRRPARAASRQPSLAKG